MSIEAMKMALKFCDDIGALGGPYSYVNGTSVVSDSRKVTTALRQAIEQAEKQEPVAWMNDDGFWEYEPEGIDDVVPLYPAPPKRKWVRLTKYQKLKIANKFHILEAAIEFIEDKLKEKNT